MLSESNKHHQTATQISEEAKHIEAAKKQPEKFEWFYKKYFKQIYLYCYQRLDGEDIASDVTSQVFLKALQNLPKYEHRGLPFAAWLYQIARNELQLNYRSKKADKTVNAETKDFVEIAEEFEGDDNSYEINLMIEALKELPADAVELIEMRFFEKRSFKEVAEILNITENNAKVKTYRTLDKLKLIIQRKEATNGAV